MSFEKIFTTIIALAPQLAAKNTHTIREWLAIYDTEKDIIPGIKDAAKRGLKTVYSFSYFTHSIQRQHEERLKREAVRPADLITIMKNRAWLRATRPHLLRPDQADALKAYEQQHGEVRI